MADLKTRHGREPAPASPAAPVPPRRGRRRTRIAVRLAAGAAVIVATVVVVGAGPFVRGVAALTPAAILAAVALCALGTAAAAWRWRVVATGIGLPLTWSRAVTAYYRSQFLNTVLPGGILGDAHRAYDHGRRDDRLALAARAVVVERLAGQLVQALLTLAVLATVAVLAPPSPVVWLSLGVAGVGLAAVAAAAAFPGVRRAIGRELRLLRPLLKRPRAVVEIVAASVVAVVALVGLFVVAGLAVGTGRAPTELAMIALIVLGAAAIPVNVGGWGPREAAGAAAFALIGVGAGVGVAASTAFGVLAMIGVAPGAAVLVGGGIQALRTARRRRSPA